MLQWHNDRRAHEISTFASLLKPDKDKDLLWSFGLSGMGNPECNSEKVLNVDEGLIDK